MSWELPDDIDLIYKARCIPDDPAFDRFAVGTLVGSSKLARA
jgi:hypothetical protein